MTITITMELTEDNLNKLKALIPSTEIPGQMTLYDSVLPEQESAALPQQTDTTPKITKTDIRAEALKLSKLNKQKELAEVFAKFGCKKLSDFDNRTEEYPALLNALKEVSV